MRLELRLKPKINPRGDRVLEIRAGPASARDSITIKEANGSPTERMVMYKSSRTIPRSVILSNFEIERIQVVSSAPCGQKPSPGEVGSPIGHPG